MSEIFDNQPVIVKKGISAKVLVIIIAVTLTVSLAFGILFGVIIANNSYLNSGILNDIGLVEEAYDLIKKHYYKDVNWKELEIYATSGLLNGLDPYSGIGVISSEEPLMGIVIKQDINNRKILLEVESNSEMARSLGRQTDENGVLIGEGISVLQRGDEIIYVNDIFVPGMSNDNFTALLKKGGYIIVKKPDGNYYKFSIIFSSFAKSEAGYIRADDFSAGNDIGYIRLDSFTDENLEDFVSAANSFIADNKANKLILDLRHNGGGSVEMLRQILPYLIADKNGNNNNLKVNLLEMKSGTMEFKTENVNDYQYFGNVKGDDYHLVVMTDGFSASASEALIGNLLAYEKDNVTLIGEATYGKGIAQQGFQIAQSNYYISMTVGYFYVPSFDSDGNLTWINNHDKPYQPDIKIKNNKIFSNIEISKENDIATAIEYLKSLN